MCAYVFTLPLRSMVASNFAERASIFLERASKMLPVGWGGVEWGGVRAERGGELVRVSC